MRKYKRDAVLQGLTPNLLRYAPLIPTLRGEGDTDARIGHLRVDEGG
jgi:hypothetical protein